jgi:hypothetical protein
MLFRMRDSDAPHSGGASFNQPLISLILERLSG